jgi:hypothetical protein
VKQHSDITLGKEYWTFVQNKYEKVVVVDILPLNNNGERRFVISRASNGNLLPKPRLAASLYDSNPSAKIKEDEPIPEIEEAIKCMDARYRHQHHKLPPRGE